MEMLHDTCDIIVRPCGDVNDRCEIIVTSWRRYMTGDRLL